MSDLETLRIGGLKLQDFTLTVPLSAETIDTREIQIFARIAAKDDSTDLPYLVFLQGGPGMEAPRPSLAPLNPSWLSVALENYRVVFLDQRGTGRSTPVNDSILQEQTPQQVAEYLSHFRADAIVRDCEALRKHLGVQKWNVLGQSFGGFTTLHYLSTHAESLDTVYFTGGLSAINRQAEEVYANSYIKMRVNSEQFYRRFPQHRDTVIKLVAQARAGEIVLPSGEIVSESRLRSLGHLLGSNDGWFDLHQLLELDAQSNAFRHDLEMLLPFSGRNPLYFVLHESSYADGVQTKWAAQRSYPEDFRQDVSLLTGEHIFSDWSESVPALRLWQEVAELLAHWHWPKLYDSDALAASNAHGAAAVYANDVFVPLDFSLDTAQHLPGVHLYITSEHEHNGLRASDGQVLAHLIDLAQGRKVR